MRHPYLYLIAMNRQEKIKLRQLVETSFNKLSKHVSELQVRDERLSRESNRIRNDRHEAELNDREVNEYALQTATKKLVALQRTLSKIEEENFGNCIRCGNPIPIARLMAVPEATKCLECAAKEPENIYPDFPAVGAYKH
jgi:DnaK suppressor protein